MPSQDGAQHPPATVHTPKLSTFNPLPAQGKDVLKAFYTRILSCHPLLLPPKQTRFSLNAPHDNRPRTCLKLFTSASCRAARCCSPQHKRDSP